MEHGHTFIEGEQGLFGGVLEHSDDDLGEGLAGALDDVEVAVGYGVEGPRTQGGQAHVRLLRVWPYGRFSTCSKGPATGRIRCTRLSP